MSQKVVSIIGTRPEIIRTSCITPLLDKSCEHTIIHTGQNFTPNLRDIFYRDLGLRQPDIYLQSDNPHGFGDQMGYMFPQIEKILNDIRPDKVFILGDTNSALCAIVAERMGIPVYHMEAANRSGNREIPEEINRKLLDHTCSYNLYYTPANRQTLISEGLSPHRMFQCGNPTLEVLSTYNKNITQSTILDQLGLEYREYFLADFHRSENVNNPDRLMNILWGLNNVAEGFNMDVVVSVHPKTKDKMKEYSTKIHDKIKFLDAFGFFDFVKLEKCAKVGLTDSGLCSEEYCLLQVPCVILRNETERPEVVEAGGAIISGLDANKIWDATVVMEECSKGWNIPDGYEYSNVSQRVVNYILSK